MPEIKLAELMVPLKSDTSDFERDMGTAGKIARGFGKNVQTLGKAALGGLGAVAAGAGLAGRQLFQMAQQAKPVRNIEKAFRSNAKAAGRSADALLAALQKQSSGLVTNRELMAQYNEATQLVGDQFANKMPQAFGALRKVAAATGKDMTFAVESFVTGTGRMSREMLDNIGVSLKMAEATEYAAEQHNKETSAVTEAEKAAAFKELALKRLLQTAEGLPDVTNSNATAMQQWQTTLQNMRDEIGTAVIPILAELGQAALPLVKQGADLLKTSLSGLQSFVSDVTGALETFRSQLESGKPPLTAFYIALKQLVPQELAGRITTIVSKVKDFVQNVKTALQPILDFIQKNVKTKDVLIALGIAIATVVIPAIWSVITAAAPIIATFAALIAIVVAVRKAWKNNFLGIRTAVKQIMTSLRETIKVVLTKIKAFWNRNGDEIMVAAKRIWNTIKRVIKVAITLIKGTILAVLAAIRGDWKKVWGTIEKHSLLVWNQIKRIFSPMVDWLKDKITGALDKLKGAWDTAMGKLESAVKPVKDAINDLKTAASNLWTWVKNHVFDFDINLPDIPDWAVPGSPLPIHTAWKDFARDFGNRTIAPRISPEAYAPGLGRAMSGGIDRSRQQTNEMTMNVYTRAEQSTVVRDWETMMARIPSS
jgi:hypothetical protein